MAHTFACYSTKRVYAGDTGSHKMVKMKHVTTEDDSNVLLQGQTVKSVDRDRSTLCTLRPGEARLHNGWALHVSMPNMSLDRRIGLNV